MYQNGKNIIPIAKTGTSRKLFSTIAMPAPTAKNSSDAAHSTGKRSSLPVAFRIVCASDISRRKRPGFLRWVVSLISSRMLLGPAVNRRNTPSVKSMGEIRKIRNAPVIMPTHAVSSRAVKWRSPPSRVSKEPAAPRWAYRFPAGVCADSRRSRSPACDVLR